MIRIQDITMNSTLDKAAETETLGGGCWKLKRIVFKKRGIKKIFIKWKCGVRYRKVHFIKYNFCGC